MFTHLRCSASLSAFANSSSNCLAFLYVVIQLADVQLGLFVL
uniref:Uncharacterized protein n=1 Tax=Schistosoma curassoni TaxID=6186 RepID=A0A183JW28_9TREM